METGFLDEIREAMNGEEQFKPRPWYNSYGDCLVFHASDEMGCADRIDGLLTLYRSLDTDDVVGFQVKGVQAILRKFELDGMEVWVKGEGEHVHMISISLILLMAVKEMEPTGTRYTAYLQAAALSGDKVPILSA